MPSDIYFWPAPCAIISGCKIGALLRRTCSICALSGKIDLQSLHLFLFCAARLRGLSALRASICNKITSFIRWRMQVLLAREAIWHTHVKEEFVLGWSHTHIVTIYNYNCTRPRTWLSRGGNKESNYLINARWKFSTSTRTAFLIVNKNMLLGGEFMSSAKLNWSRRIILSCQICVGDKTGEKLFYLSPCVV